MNADEIGQKLVPILKEQGFKKRKLTWYRHFDKITVVFNIQKSQYSSDTWFYNYGIGINYLFDKEINSIQQCDIIFRFDQVLDGKRLQAEDLNKILLYWIEKYGAVNKLKTLAREGKLPRMTTIRAKEYLLTMRDT